VLIYPPPPATRDGVTSTNFGMHEPKVQKIVAASPQEAASIAKVQAGGYALVFPMSEGRRYDRPAVAALEEKQIDGQPLPVAVSA
jgi:hypothetical protein